jgi:hypothetical protein
LVAAVAAHPWVDAVSFPAGQSLNIFSLRSIAFSVFVTEVELLSRRDFARQPHIRPDQRPHHYPEYGQSGVPRGRPHSRKRSMSPVACCGSRPLGSFRRSDAYSVSFVIAFPVD